MMKALLKNTHVNTHQTWNRKGVAFNVLVAYLVGLIGGVALAVFVLSPTLRNIGLWIATLSLFHLWEFSYVALFHADELSFNSFLLNHSPQYTMAFVAAVAEFVIEYALFPSLKSSKITLVIGGILMVGGLAIRIVAMFTAGSNFHHLVREEREENHKLVTNGIYQYLRHPSYFGWFWCNVGGQILIFNPICIVGYAYAAWTFFHYRIIDEEAALIRFFGDDYKKYRERTIVGIPFIK